MTTSTQALATACDALQRAHPGRKIGNILVEPAGDHYQVLLVDLPVKSEREKVPKAVRINIDRNSGAVTEVKEVELGKSPYLASDIPEATMSGKRAFELGLAALKGFEDYGKEGRLTVELVGGTYRVTFPLPASQHSGRGADYACQVWLDPVTGNVVKTLVAS